MMDWTFYTAVHLFLRYLSRILSSFLCAHPHAPHLFLPSSHPSSLFSPNAGCKYIVFHQIWTLNPLHSAILSSLIRYPSENDTLIRHDLKQNRNGGWIIQAFKCMGLKCCPVESCRITEDSSSGVSNAGNNLRPSFHHWFTQAGESHTNFNSLGTVHGQTFIIHSPVLWRENLFLLYMYLHMKRNPWVWGTRIFK